MSVTIKIHDILHNPWRDGTNVESIERRIESAIVGFDVENVRIAKGWKNSPVFVTLDQEAVSIQSMKLVADDVCREMEECVGGVNAQWAMREKNLKVVG